MSGPRRQAREAALQILYFWEVGKAEPMAAVEAYFAEHQPDAPAAVTDFATRLVFGTIEEVHHLDQLIDQHATHWRVERLAVVDRLVLRLSIWELLHEMDTPAAAIINEGLELARLFSGDEAVRFVNGVLDGAADSLGRRQGPADAASQHATED